MSRPHVAASTPSPSPSPSHLPPLPSSPTFTYASTANPLSSYSLPLPPPPRPAHTVLTKSDLELSHTAYADLLGSAKSYRLALAALSTAASTFGSALESCARLKEARAESLTSTLTTAPAGGNGNGNGGGASSSSSAAELMGRSFHAAAAAHPCTADTLLSAAGLQHLIANHQQILSETVYRSFEVPLLHELDKWRAAVEDEEAGYAAAVRLRAAEIRRLERDGVRLHRQKKPRDLRDFRRHLVDLTEKLDGLTVLHGEHARTLLRESQDTSVRIVEASCSLVRAEVDIFEGLARKGWSGGGLEEVLERGVDVLSGDGAGGRGGDDEDEDEGGGELFSILPPKSILADSGVSDSAAGAGARMQTRSDSLLVSEGDHLRYQSLAGAVGGSDRDGDSVFSEFNRPRLGPVRPFSPQPQPLRMNPDRLILGGFEEEDEEEDEDEEDEETRTSLDLTARPLGEADAKDADEHSDPWRNEGLDDKARSRGDQDTPSRSPSPTSGQGEQSPLMASPETAKRRWSVVVEDHHIET